MRPTPAVPADLRERMSELLSSHERSQQWLLDDSCRALTALLAEADCSAQQMLATAAHAAKEDWPSQLVAVCIDAGRRRGASWEEVGTAFGVSRQAVHQRFSRAVDRVRQLQGDDHRSDREPLADALVNVLARSAPLGGGPPASGLWKVPTPPQLGCQLIRPNDSAYGDGVAIYHQAQILLSLGERQQARRMLRMAFGDERVKHSARLLLAQLESRLPETDRSLDPASPEPAPIAD